MTAWLNIKTGLDEIVTHKGTQLVSRTEGTRGVRNAGEHSKGGDARK